MPNTLNVRDADGAVVAIATNDAVIDAINLLKSVVDGELTVDTDVSALGTEVTLEAIRTLLDDTLAVSVSALPLPSGAATEASVGTIGTRAYDWASGQVIAFSGVSAQSAGLSASEVLLSADRDCWISVGSNPTASIGAGSLFLVTGAPMHMQITSGDKIAVIESEDAGNLSVLPVA